jgi:hypothetical protein
MSTRTSLEEGIKFHGFPGIFPDQFFTETGRHREAMVTADQRMVIRYYRDDLASFVDDFSHASSWRLLSGSVDLTDTATCHVDVKPGQAPGSPPPRLAISRPRVGRCNGQCALSDCILCGR